MRLNIEKLNSFDTTMQMTVARKADRFVSLSRKSSKAAHEQAEMDRLTSELAPFDLDALPSDQSYPSRRDVKTDRIADDSVGIVLNSRKVDQANLTGTQSLALHRQSIAMARLLNKAPEHRSMQESTEFDRLRENLRRFVGMEGVEGKDSDFKRALS